MNKKIMFLTAICATLLSFQTQAADRAAGQVLTSPRPVERSSEWRPHVGLTAGATQPESNGNNVGEYGLDVGYQAFIPVSLGLEYMHSRLEYATGDQDRDSVFMKATYNFAGDNSFLRRTYAAIAAGAVITNQTSAAIAPILGFDIPLKSETKDNGFLSVGANTRYTFVGNNEDDTFSVTGVVKYWY